MSVFTLNKAHVFYGHDIFDIHGLDSHGFYEIQGVDIDTKSLCEAIAKCVGKTDASQFTTTIKVVHKEEVADFNIPEMVVASGDGFCISWKR